MILRNDAKMTNQMVASCYRFAIRMRLTIEEGLESARQLFTIKEAYEDDDVYWFDKANMSVDDFAEFLRMCEAYKPADISSKVPTATYVFKVDCPNCHKLVLTPQQMEMNKMTINGVQYIVCLNCSEILELEK